MTPNEIKQLVEAVEQEKRQLRAALKKVKNICRMQDYCDCCPFVCVDDEGQIACFTDTGIDSDLSSDVPENWPLNWPEDETNDA